MKRADLTVIKSADVRYLGQYHEVEIVLPEGDITDEHIKKLEEEFHEKHAELYTFSLPWIPVEFLNLRMIAKVRGERMSIGKVEAGTADSSGAVKQTRQCYFGGRYRETPIYDREKLKAGNTFSGPAIVEEALTTVVIPEKFRCKIDDYGNYIIERI